MATEQYIKDNPTIQHIFNHYMHYDPYRLICIAESNFLIKPITSHTFPKEIALRANPSPAFNSTALSACSTSNNILTVAINTNNIDDYKLNISQIFFARIFFLLFLSQKKVDPILNFKFYAKYLHILSGRNIACKNRSPFVLGAKPGKINAASLSFIINEYLPSISIQIKQFATHLAFITHATVIGANSVLGDNAILGNHIATLTQKIQIVIGLITIPQPLRLCSTILRIHQLPKLIKYYLPQHFRFDLMLHLSNTKQSFQYLGITNIALGYTTWLGSSQTLQIIKYRY